MSAGDLDAFPHGLEVPIPAVLVTRVVWHYDPVPGMTSRLRFRVDVGRIVISAQSLRVMPR